MSVSDADFALLDTPPDLRADGRVAWITGAGRGLGRSIAIAMAGAGADLILTGRSREPLDEVHAAIANRGGRAIVAQGSVTDSDHVSEVAEKISDAYGRLDVLVNNAGISPYFVRSERLDPDQLREVLEVNLVGAFSCCRSALPLLERSSAPSIVNVSSVHGSRSHARMLAYASSKGGMEMMTKTLADEWAERGVRVNSLAPGYIETEMSKGIREHEELSTGLLRRTPLKRFATTAEIAVCALFLASPISSYVTGVTLFADGGWSAR